MKKFKDGAMTFATNKNYGKYYVYNCNGMGVQQLGVYDNEESVLSDYPTAEFETLHEIQNCLNK